MKVLHVMPTYLPATRYGGPMFAVHALCRELARLDHEVHVYTTTMDGDGDSDVPRGHAVERDGVQVWYHATTLRRPAFSATMAAQLRERAAHFDVVHTHSVFLWPPWYAARNARRRRVPYVMAPRGMLVPELIRRRSRFLKTAWLRLLEWPNLTQAGALHFTSVLERSEAERLGVPVGRAAVIPNGVDLAPDMPPAERSPYVLHLGRVNWKKGLDRLVRALPHVPAVHVVIAGPDEDGCTQSLQRLARECGVAQRVTFAGPVYGEAKQRLLCGARLLALPSLSENFGNAVLEALAARCPVVVTREVGLAEVVRKADCGVVADAEPRALAAALGRLWNEEALRRAMGERGRNLVERDYSWPRVARQMAALYQSIARP